MSESDKLVVETYLAVKSIRKTAQMTGYSKTGVEWILKKTDTPRFERSRSGKENSLSKAIASRPDQDPSQMVRNQEVMQRLYLEEKLSVPAIANQLGTSRTTVLTGLRTCGIQLRSKSEALKGRARPNAQGSKNANWKGGLSGWRKLARGRLNEHFVRPIMERDGFQCQWCGSKQPLVVHHHKRSFQEIVEKIALKISKSEIEDFVNAIVIEHSLDDGVTLCAPCHNQYHAEYGK
jgi:5-methylcytosine-specific restriction endonuclease McrA